MKHKYSSREIEAACKTDIRFMWVLQGEPAPNDSMILRFHRGHLAEINRKNFSKTDTDATFMHMKEDRMRNGQLKPGYSIQIGVESEYIVGIGAFSNRSDVQALIRLFHISRFSLY